MTLLLHFATQREARATVDLLKAQRDAVDPVLYHFDGGELLISGIGMIASTAAVSRHARRGGTVWNLGIAGSFDDSLKLGQEVRVRSVSRFLSPAIDLDAYSRNFFIDTFPPLQLQDEGYRLLSVDYPMHTRPLEICAQLVDMEGYGVIQAAQAGGCDVHSIKIVSDFTRPDGAALIRKHIDDWSDALAQSIAEELGLSTVL